MGKVIYGALSVVGLAVWGVALYFRTSDKSTPPWFYVVCGVSVVVLIAADVHRRRSKEPPR